jgi:hypothetical protein
MSAAWTAKWRAGSILTRWRPWLVEDGPSGPATGTPHPSESPGVRRSSARQLDGLAVRGELVVTGPALDRLRSRPPRRPPSCISAPETADPI